MTHIDRWIRSQVRPIIQTEHQFVYFCHLVGPLYQRVHTEKPRLLVEVSAYSSHHHVEILVVLYTVAGYGDLLDTTGG